MPGKRKEGKSGVKSFVTSRLKTRETTKSFLSSFLPTSLSLFLGKQSKGPLMDYFKESGSLLHWKSIMGGIITHGDLVSLILMTYFVAFWGKNVVYFNVWYVETDCIIVLCVTVESSSVFGMFRGVGDK